MRLCTPPYDPNRARPANEFLAATPVSEEKEAKPDTAPAQHPQGVHLVCSSSCRSAASDG